MKALAIFDFDGTITRHDTFFSFGRFSLGFLRFYMKLALSVPTFLKWKFGRITNSQAKEKIFSKLYGGFRLDEFSNYCQKFVTVVDKDIRNEILCKLQWHQNQGHHIIIASASIENWIIPWANSHSIHDVIATKIETSEKGILTGRFSTANCYGQEKVARIRKTIHKLENHEIWVYSDNASADNPLLSIAQHTYIVKT